MGIPGFYREIIKKYDIQKFNLDHKLDYFFLDFNGIIYDVFYGLPSNKIENNKKFENYLINEILKHTKELIVNVIKPTKCVYISIDGPAPRAKMIQQRSRRYKGTVFDPMIKNQIRKNFNKPNIEPGWNPSINASTCTKFMMKLSNSLKQKIVKNYFGKNLNIILSDAFCPGEGEHKFLNYIRNLKENKKTSYCLYGKDADLIVLSLTLNKDNVYVCRPLKDQKNNSKKYEYLSIDIMKKSVFNEIMQDFPKPHPKNINIDSIISDSTFFFSLVGNDFVKAPFYLKLTQESLNILLNSYKVNLILLKTPLIIESNNNKNNKVKYSVNHEFLTKIIQELAIQEDKLMKNYYFRKIKFALNGRYKHSKEKEYNSEFDYLIKKQHICQNIQQINHYLPIYLRNQ